MKGMVSVWTLARHPKRVGWGVWGWRHVVEATSDSPPPESMGWRVLSVRVVGEVFVAVFTPNELLEALRARLPITTRFMHFPDPGTTPAALVVFGRRAALPVWPPAGFGN